MSFKGALTISAAFLFIGSGSAHGTDADEHVDAMSREHAGDRPIASGAAADVAAGPVSSQSVVYATVEGREIRGHLAEPDGAAPGGPALLVIHEWWGLNDNVREMTDRLAGLGYTALAVDLYEGEVGADPKAARALMQKSLGRVDALAANLRGARDFLAARKASKVGTIGWCFGGGWSLQTALLMPDRIDASVIYYGRLERDRERLATLDTPVLGLFGSADKGIPVASVREFEASMKALGKDAAIHVYDGADHAFANPSGTRYDPKAAADAWQKTSAFLAQHLR
jgi:carboxymethylenebutenolidase